jgi:hypothetical protein
VICVTGGHRLSVGQGFSDAGGDKAGTQWPAAVTRVYSLCFWACFSINADHLLETLVPMQLSLMFLFMFTKICAFKACLLCKVAY